jgi:hypothetical protein
MGYFCAKSKSMSTSENKGSGRIYPLLLLLLLIAVGVLSYMQFSSNATIDDLETEKELLRYDLRDYISRYDDIKTDNDSLREVISKERAQLVMMLDSINNLRAGDLSKLKQLQKSLYQYKLENQRLMAVADSLWSANIRLTEEKAQVEAALEEEVERGVELAQDKARLSREVTRGAVLQVTSLQLDAYRVRSDGSESSTNKASRTERMKACFTLAANPIAQSGPTTIYMRITSDNKQVIMYPRTGNPTQTFNFNGGPLLYSAKKDVLYENVILSDCIALDIPEKEELPKGVYRVELYSEQVKLTEGFIELN